MPHAGDRRLLVATEAWNYRQLPSGFGEAPGPLHLRISVSVQRARGSRAIRRRHPEPRDTVRAALQGAYERSEAGYFFRPATFGRRGFLGLIVALGIGGLERSLPSRASNAAL